MSNTCQRTECEVIFIKLTFIAPVVQNQNTRCQTLFIWKVAIIHSICASVISSAFRADILYYVVITCVCNGDILSALVIRIYTKLSTFHQDYFISINTQKCFNLILTYDNL